MEEELLYCGELEKLASTARGRAWRRFFIRLTDRCIRWHLTTEMNEKIFLGQLEVSRIVNVKLDPKSEWTAGGYSVFFVNDPEESHEFRTRSQQVSEEWIHHIKNATLPKTRRKRLEDHSNRDRLQSSNSNTSKGSSLSTNESGPVPHKPAMVTEIIGGTHIARPSEKQTNTILIMNADRQGIRKKLTPPIPRSLSSDDVKLKVDGGGKLQAPRKHPSPRSLRGEDTLARNNRYSFSLSNFYPFSNRPSVDTDISESGSEGLNSPILREGYLIKQGHKIKSWRRRWFTLSRSVIIYRDDEDTSEKGRICLSDVNLVRRSDRYPDKKFLFEIITKHRTYYVTASSEDELTSWTDAISNIIVSSNNSNYDTASLGSS